MEIKITIDATPLKRLIRRVGKRRLFVGTVAAVVLGASTYAYAVADPIAFESGSVISSSDVNTNFTTVYSAVTALEEEERPQSCAWTYKFGDDNQSIGDTTDSVACPANTHPIAGSCISLVGGAIDRSQPSDIGGGASEPVTDGTGWVCSRDAAGGMDMRVLCCSF